MIYLDNATTSYPKPEVVYNEMDIWMRKYSASFGRAGHRLSLKLADKIYSTRELVSKLFNIKNPMQVVFTSNGTDSLNIALKGLLTPGSDVITTSMEHNSMIRPIFKLKDIGVENTIINCNQDGELDLAHIEQAIKPNTRLIALLHASNVTGGLMPIEAIGKIAKKNNILFLLDAAQTAGLYPIDVEKMNIDILAAPGHKGLLGPQGTGILYVREGIELNTIKEGGTGSKSELLTQPNIMPDLLESGTLNTPGIVGLGASIDFILNEGIEKISLHEEILTEYFLNGINSIEGIKVYGPKNRHKRIGVVSVSIKEEPSSVISHVLDEVFDISIRAGLHCSPLAHKTIGTFERGTIRFSLGYFNTKEDIDKTLEALRRISHQV